MKQKNIPLEIIIKELGKHKRQTALLMFLILAVVLASLVPPQILRIIIDTKLTPRIVQGLLPLAIVSIGCLVLIAILDFIKSTLLILLGQNSVQNLRAEMASKLTRLPMDFFTTHTAGEVTSRFSNDAENVNTLFANGLVDLVIDLSKIIGIIISIAIFSVKLALLCLAFLPLIWGITKYFRAALLQSQMKNLAQLGKVNSHLSETLMNIHIVKAYAKETYMEQQYSKKLGDNFQTIDKVNFYDSIYSSIVTITKALLIALVVVLSCDSVNALGITLGMVAASLDLVSDLFKPIDALGMELQNIQKGVSGIDRVNQFLTLKEDKSKNEKLTLKEIMATNTISVAFHKVSFHYSDSNEMVLKDFNLEIPSGKKVTFVGRTGVGKTTLFRLILGLLEPTEGSITINGYDVYSIPNKLKRQLYGYVQQQFIPIKGTLLEQISLKDPEITEERCAQVLNYVGLEELESLYHEQINEQSTLSQGQKQLLSIARAIVCDPQFLLLDEITASLDSKTEKRLIDALDKVSKGRTVLSISHRKNTMLDCDLMVVIENGRISQWGKPDEIVS